MAGLDLLRKQFSGMVGAVLYEPADAVLIARCNEDEKPQKND